MKKIGLSLIVTTVLTSSLVANNDLVEALQNGKFFGQAKLFHQQGNNNKVAATPLFRNTKTASAMIELGYKSDSFYGFKFGIAGYASWDLGLHNKDGGPIDRSSEDDPRNTITTQKLQQLYLDYGYSKSSIKVGRQLIHTPLIFSDTIVFPITDSYDGIVLDVGELDNTNVKLIYINRWNKVYGNEISYGSSFVESNVIRQIQKDWKYDDGLYSIYIKNNSYKPLVLDAQYMTNNQKGRDGYPNDKNGDIPVQVFGGYDQYFLRANYKLPINYPIKVETTYSRASFDEPQNVKGAKKADLVSAKIITNIYDVGINFAYSHVGDDADYPGALGALPDFLCYTHALLNKTLYAGLSTFSLESNYKFTPKLATSLKLIHINQSSKGMEVTGAKVSGIGAVLEKVNEINLVVHYDMSSILKGLSIRAQLGYSHHYGSQVKSSGTGQNATFGMYQLAYKF